VRIDQLMNFNWKFLVPISIANILVVAFLLKVVQALGLAPTPDRAHDLIANLPQALILLLGNLLLAWAVLHQLRNMGRDERLLRPGDRKKAVPQLSEPGGVPLLH
jgi:hypothetical protein